MTQFYVEHSWIYLLIWRSGERPGFHRLPYSQPRSRVNSISKNEMNIRISLCNVRRVNGMLDISLEIVPKKTH